jgi:hypothetical protein
MPILCQKNFDIFVDLSGCGSPSVNLVSGTPGYPPPGDGSCGGGADRWLPWTLGGSLCLDFYSFFGLGTVPLAWIVGTGNLSFSLCRAVRTVSFEIHSLLSRNLAETITFDVHDELGNFLWGPTTYGPPAPVPPGSYLAAKAQTLLVCGDGLETLHTYTLSVSGSYSTFPFYSVIGMLP